jgi:DNA-directed RNA polymerase I and III subunit RPAC1
LKLLAIKGIGKDHAKFSPVSLASYKLLPEIKLHKHIIGKDAYTLQKCFSPGVIEIDKGGEAFVKNARNDNCSRNIYRHPELAKYVELTRIRNHFVFNIESLGAYQPEDIFIEAAKILKKKCVDLLKELDFDGNKN